MARVRIARPRHVIGWLAVLGALAWFTQTQLAGSVDQSFAGWVSDLHGARDGRVDSLMLTLSEIIRPIYVAPVTLVAAALLWFRFRAWALLLPASFGSSIAVTYAMKWFLDRDRPGEEFSLVNLHDAAFPSAHVAAVTSSGMAAMQLAIPVLRRTARKLLDLAIIALIGAVALSRVWVGAHWLTDVIGGLIAGVIGLAVALLVLRRWPRARRYALP
ncbi:phosphatase PAP2 family protein [Corynebacterium sp. 5QC2CO]|uniref:phosphatase PAP2 family protein n=1 Tax=Corynebacterium sp. 5QC2CO TaxID=2968468 RepID=UPI001D4C4DD8|nr:phosphatase PAP2 family protein [Corynebacterium sp. 5QC2CO]HJE84370.1 phosphatase PAP2 family protein [Corynebacterium amycolatum]